jgi:hypothetical protein
MFTRSTPCRDQHTASNRRPGRPSQTDTRNNVEQELRVAEMIARAIQDNASQLYRGA